MAILHFAGPDEGMRSDLHGYLQPQPPGFVLQLKHAAKRMFGLRKAPSRLRHLLCSGGRSIHDVTTFLVPW